MMDRSQLQRDALNLELQNAIQLNDLLMIQDMVQADSVEAGLALARVAQLGGSDEMLRLLLQLGAQPDATDEFGRTAVLLAVSRGDKRMTVC
jgi:ankyrin repeat protein